MQFGKLPKDVMQAPVSMGAKVLYGALAMYRNGRTLQCNPSHAQLAETIGVSATHINNLANELDRAGLIQRTVTPGRQTCYTLPHLSVELDASTTTQEQLGGLPNNRPGVETQTTQEQLGTPPKNSWGVSYKGI